jgi:hypothetical protein
MGRVQLRIPDVSIQSPWKTAGGALLKAGVDMRAAAELLKSIDAAHKEAFAGAAAAHETAIANAADAHDKAIAGAITGAISKARDLKTAHKEVIVGAAVAHIEALDGLLTKASDVDVAHKKAFAGVAAAHGQAIAEGAAAHDKAIAGFANKAADAGVAHEKAVADATAAHDKAIADLVSMARDLDTVGSSLVDAGKCMQKGQGALDLTAKALVGAGMAAHNTGIAAAAEGLVSAGADLTDAADMLCGPSDENCCVPDGWYNYASTSVVQDAADALESAAAAIGHTAKAGTLSNLAGTPASDAFAHLFATAEELTYASNMLKDVTFKGTTCSAAGAHFQ